jgi:elongation factor 1-gamma
MHTIFLERQLRGLYTLEKHISSRTFFVGERITLADIYIAALTQRACSVNIDTPTRAKIPNLMRHLDTIVNQPAFANIFPPTKELETAPVYVAPKKEKEAKPAAPAAPKAEKKAKPKVEEEEEDDNLVPEEPKAKNPLDDLPKSTLNLEDWKRAYSNKETRGAGGAIEWFYEKCASCSPLSRLHIR